MVFVLFSVLVGPLLLYFLLPRYPWIRLEEIYVAADQPEEGLKLGVRGVPRPAEAGLG